MCSSITRGSTEALNTTPQVSHFLSGLRDFQELETRAGGERITDVIARVLGLGSFSFGGLALNDKVLFATVKSHFDIMIYIYYNNIF